MQNKVDQKLKSLIERIERLEGEKRETLNDISLVYKEAKSEGFDVKVMKKLIRLRREDPEKVQEEEYLLETYKEAIQMDLFKHSA